MINYKSYLIFLFASLAVSIGLQMVLPFPYGLGAALALFIAFPLLLRRRMMNRMRGGTGGSSGGGFGGGLFVPPTQTGIRDGIEIALDHKRSGGKSSLSNTAGNWRDRAAQYAQIFGDLIGSTKSLS